MGFVQRWSLRLATLISLAVAARLFGWALIPADRFALDELSYYNAGISVDLRIHLTPLKKIREGICAKGSSGAQF